MLFLKENSLDRLEYTFQRWHDRSGDDFAQDAKEVWHDVVGIFGNLKFAGGFIFAAIVTGAPR